MRMHFFCKEGNMFSLYLFTANPSVRKRMADDFAHLSLSNPRPTFLKHTQRYLREMCSVPDCGIHRLHLHRPFLFNLCLLVVWSGQSSYSCENSPLKANPFVMETTFQAVKESSWLHRSEDIFIFSSTFQLSKYCIVVWEDVFWIRA